MSPTQWMICFAFLLVRNHSREKWRNKQENATFHREAPVFRGYWLVNDYLGSH